MSINLKQLVAVLREVIREEVKTAIHEELLNLGKEAMVERAQSKKAPIKENITPNNTAKPIKRKELIPKEKVIQNPMLAMIAQTANEMEDDGTINSFGREDALPGMETSVLDFAPEIVMKNIPKAHSEEWPTMNGQPFTTNDVLPTTPPMPDMNSEDYGEVEDYSNPMLEKLMNGGMAAVVNKSKAFDGSHPRRA